METVTEIGSEVELRSEFDRQVESLTRLGYPGMAGLEAGEFRRRVARLKDVIPPRRTVAEDGRIPFVVVVRREIVPSDRAMTVVELRGRRGFTDMAADDLRRFAPIDGLEIPDGPAYLVIDIDTGQSSLNVTPDEGIKLIDREGRSPLTIDEGVALITHHPEVLTARNCFSMLGSRCGDRRVTAMWISKGRPRLGWCWAGNPHTWLGSASCGGRAGA